MAKKETQNCWEYLHCSKKDRENCPAYQNDMGGECWFVMDIEKGCPAAKEYGGCFNCPWYKKLNPNP